LVPPGPGAACGSVAFVGELVAAVGGSISACCVVVPLVCRPLAFVGKLVPLILGGLPLVGQAFAFVGFVVALVGQAFAPVGVLVGCRAGVSPSLVGTFALGGGPCPTVGLDGSGSRAGPALGVGLVAKISSDHSPLCRLSPLLGDLLFARPNRLGLFGLFGLFSHASALLAPHQRPSPR
jgi:hypothetical protein